MGRVAPMTNDNQTKPDTEAHTGLRSRLRSAFQIKKSTLCGKKKSQELSHIL